MRTGVLCTILVLCTVIVFIPVTVKFFSVVDERGNVYTQYELADMPLLTLQELWSEFYRVSRLIAEPVGDNADEYYVIHKQVLARQFHAPDHEHQRPQRLHVHGGPVGIAATEWAVTWHGTFSYECCGDRWLCIRC